MKKLIAKFAVLFLAAVCLITIAACGILGNSNKEVIRKLDKISVQNNYSFWSGQHLLHKGKYYNLTDKGQDVYGDLGGSAGIVQLKEDYAVFLYHYGAKNKRPSSDYGGVSLIKLNFKSGKASVMHTILDSLWWGYYSGYIMADDGDTAVFATADRLFYYDLKNNSEGFGVTYNPDHTFGNGGARYRTFMGSNFLFCDGNILELYDATQNFEKTTYTLPEEFLYHDYYSFKTDGVNLWAVKSLYATPEFPWGIDIATGRELSEDECAALNDEYESEEQYYLVGGEKCGISLVKPEIDETQFRKSASYVTVKTDGDEIRIDAEYMKSCKEYNKINDIYNGVYDTSGEKGGEFSLAPNSFFVREGRLFLSCSTAVNKYALTEGYMWTSRFIYEFDINTGKLTYCGYVGDNYGGIAGFTPRLKVWN